jgi:hypothetical protein
MRTLRDDQGPAETTFQPKIGEPNIGSSSTNWRRTEHPVPPPLRPSPGTNNSDISLLIAELKAQLDEDRSRRKRDKYCIRRKADLEEQTRVTAIIAAVSKRIKDDEVLKPDGSNLRQWERMLCVHASECFGNSDYFSTDKDTVRDPSDKQIARGIIHSSVHSKLTYNLLNLQTSGYVFNHLIMKFRIMNRAAQIQEWLDFVRLDPGKHPNTASLSEAFSSLGKTFAEQGVSLTWDDMLGLIIQSNLKDALLQSVDQKVDLYLETHNFNLPTAQDMLRFVDAARTEARLANTSKSSDVNSLRVSLASRTDCEDASADNLSPVNAWALAKVPKCFICKRTDYLAPDCPNKRRSNNAPMRPSPFSGHPYPPCSITYNFDKAPYVRPLQPETAPPRQAPRNPQQMNRQPRQPSSQTPAAIEAKLMSTDLFADNVDKDFTFENEEPLIKPSFNRLDLREVSVDHDGQDVIWDSGASNNVTGNRYALHNFMLLKKPIAVRVATDGPRDFITGTGTLKFSRTRQTTIVVKNIYYCENARSTLLSLAAFKKSNAQFCMKDNFDVINLVSPTGKLLIRSKFDTKTNTWPVDKLLRAPCSDHFFPTSCNSSPDTPVEMNSLLSLPTPLSLASLRGIPPMWCPILVSSIKCGKKGQFLYIIGIKLDILLHNPTLQGPKPIITHQKHSVLHA